MDDDAIVELFEAALEVPPGDQTAFVRARCGDDEAMFTEVMELLAADGLKGPSLLENAGPRAPLGGVHFRPGQHVGSYEILEQIGEGGFAVVYLAKQLEPVRRQVALKTIKPGMATEVVLTRFEAESQALALMDHPYIAEVFDVGTAERGLPYFAMEYVEGEPITEHCVRYGLDLDDRLELFVKCCEAVQHAHQKAVIHRDLKPSNILVRQVEGRSWPKIIDFGVAKALEQKLTPNTFHTVGGMLVGTPAYMSPEQLSLEGSRGIDTRADVYALGVVLYELLVGEMPFEGTRLEPANLAHLLRSIREDNAPRPSTRVSRSRPRSGERARVPIVAQQLSGDLDWIVLKALEKDPDRRYASARELAEDIERHRADEPVRARPPSAAYRASKYLRRHTGFVVAVAVAGLFLLMLAGSKAIQANRERRARRELAQVVEFQATRLKDIDALRMGEQLQRDLLAQARTQRLDPDVEEEADASDLRGFERIVARANFTTLAAAAIEDHVFKPALAALDTQFDEQPETRARLLQSLVDEMRSAGILAGAAEAQEEALALRRRVLGAQHPETLTSIDAMGMLLRERGKFAEAELFFREALAGRRKVLGETHPATMDSAENLGVLLRQQGQLAEAEPYYREVLETRRQIFGARHPDTLGAVGNLGVLLQYQNKLREAEPYFVEALEGKRQTLGEDHPRTLAARAGLGLILLLLNRATEAEPHIRSALEGRRKHFGDEHPETLHSLGLVARLYAQLKRFREAEPLYRKVLEVRRRVLGDRHPRTLLNLNDLGFVVAMQDKFSEAEKYYREVIESFQEAFEQPPTSLISTFGNLGFVLIAQKKYTEAERLLRESLPVYANFVGDHHWRTAECRSLLGEALVGLERYAEAEPLLLEGYARLEVAVPQGRREEKLRSAARRLEALYRRTERPEAAADWGAKPTLEASPAQ